MKWIILAIPLALGACVQNRAATLPPDTPKAVVVKTIVDDKIAAATSAFSTQCTLVNIALTGASFFVKGTTATRWLENTRVGVASYCNGPPPANVEDALLALQRIYRDIMTRVPETKAYVDEQWAIYIRTR